MMEYISGVDLMRVVTKATYLNIDHVQIVIAQLILALEHLHLRGFLHRDVKVSNMLIIPGGRVKLIDFDTNKVCLGHFSKRLVKAFFARTAFEFHDGESAGTIPYMAPEILKRRPYGKCTAQIPACYNFADSCMCFLRRKSLRLVVFRHCILQVNDWPSTLQRKDEAATARSHHWR
ncbi:microtubule-associated serine/threonine-protein kinase 3-like [Rhipicephalus microplus]|uniref:microtubule-associated serine/threonine-protein kinase 3-like n=1 Tax=Rhipicephalus microplus TaxID=6941 RepID=UPI003F6D9DD8